MTRFTAMAFILSLTCFSSLMGADGGCGEPPVLDNNGFDLWCGNQLCYWEIEAGNVTKAPTWHRSDFGAEFVGPIAAISQLSDIDSSTTCLHFRAVANVDLDAIVTVEVDYYDDGVYEVEQRVPTSEWAQIEFELPTPTAYRGARFRIRKEGPGKAILAEMQVYRATKCVEPPVVIPPLELGEICSDDFQCGDFTCEVVEPFEIGLCSECDRDSDCSDGEACGVLDPGDPDQPFGAECGPEARHGIGERCIGDAECGSGICCGGVCSSCCPDFRDGACASSCATATPGGPAMCDATSGLAEAGEACIEDLQCASGSCDGTPIRVCAADGRVCGDITDCEGNTACVNVGVSDGICQ